MKVSNRLTKGFRFSMLALCVSSTLTANKLLAQVTVVPLPTLGGSYTAASGLNNSGQVVGYSRTSGDRAQHAFRYDSGAVSDLGTLGGTFSLASGINANHQVIGDASTANDAASHAFLFSGGIMLDIGTLGGSFSSATAVNDAGQVVGDSYLTGNLQIGAFLFTDGAITSLGTLGGSYSSAAAINIAGQVAGEAAVSYNVATHAFLFRDGAMLDLGTLGGQNSFAAALNDAGQVIGGSETAQGGETHAFLFENGVMKDLGTLGGSYSTAIAINSSGQIVGGSTTLDDAEYHGFIYSNGSMRDLGTLGGSFSTVYSINNHGQVVGESSDVEEMSYAFLWENGVLTELNTLLPPDSEWDLWSAQFINDAGQIVGYGSFKGGFNWFLLSLGSANQPPVADAGSDLAVECGGAAVLNGSASTDPDDDALSYEWREGNVLLGTGVTLSVGPPLGAHAITLTVTDPDGASAQDTVTVNVVDTTAPVGNCPAPLMAVADASGQAAVPDFLANWSVSDNCTAANGLTKTQNPSAGGMVGCGSHVITVTVADASGNISDCATVFNVTDLTAPVIQSVTATPNVLSPPNHSMVPVTLTVSASDNVDPTPVSRIISISSDEPLNGPGDSTGPAWEITGNLTADLRAERSPQSNGRTYTLTVECQDAAGNATTQNVAVFVPKQNSSKPKKG